MTNDLYLVRHGQTLFNRKKMISGWTDSPLTELGLEQARRAGAFLRHRGLVFDHAYTSTLTRTHVTIQAVMPGIEFEQRAGIREWFFGEYEGERISLMPQRPWGDYFAHFGGESQQGGSRSHDGDAERGYGSSGKQMRSRRFAWIGYQRVSRCGAGRRCRPAQAGTRQCLHHTFYL